MSHYLLGGIASFCLLASLIPFIPVPHGAFRIFDFGRLQIAIMAFVTLILVVTILPLTLQTAVFIGMLSLSIVIQLAYIVRFTPFWKIQSARIHLDGDDKLVIKLLACNVKQGNKDYSRLIKLIEEYDPDIFVLMETDQSWIDALDTPFSKYEQKISCPQDNSYGMFLASKLDMPVGELRFLLNDSIPSFHCTFQLSNNRQFDLISLHPDPPVPHRDTVGRDAEILVVGKIATKRVRPLIVTGDLNDVAWSATTRRFLRISRLLDPRQGRGLFNSFDARFPFLRWPLDHIFHSDEFELAKIKRLPFIGSDHFPMYYELALVFNDNNTLPKKPTSADFEASDTLIEKEKIRDRKPVGEDWENPK